MRKKIRVLLIEPLSEPRIVTVEHTLEKRIGGVSAEVCDWCDALIWLSQKFVGMFKAKVVDFGVDGVANRFAEPQICQTSGAAHDGGDICRRKTLLRCIFADEGKRLADASIVLDEQAT